MAVLGAGAFRFETVPDWPRLPAGMGLKEVAAVAVDREDRVFLFTRGDHPIMVFDRDGSFLSSWGEGIFSAPHGASSAADGSLWLVDEGDHTVRRCSVEGKVEREIGTPNAPAAFHSGAPFNRPTHAVVDPGTGELYVSDGYGNARVHRFDQDGRRLASWGGSGTDPGEFNLPHNLALDRDGRLYVADRENHRVQIFDRSGRVLDQWVNMHRACALWIEADGPRDHVYVSELGPTYPFNKEAPGLGPRISVYTTAGDCVARIGNGPAGEGDGDFITPHGLAMDSRGDLYVGETSWSTTGRYLDPPRELRSLQKLRRC